MSTEMEKGIANNSCFHGFTKQKQNMNSKSAETQGGMSLEM
jgi:hypothetical protein